MPIGGEPVSCSPHDLSVLTVLEALKYPEFMDDFERKILEVAR
jgi:hypothetical protein